MNRSSVEKRGWRSWRRLLQVVFDGFFAVLVLQIGIVLFDPHASEAFLVTLGLLLFSAIRFYRACYGVHIEKSSRLKSFCDPIASSFVIAVALIALFLTLSDPFSLVRSPVYHCAGDYDAAVGVRVALIRLYPAIFAALLIVNACYRRLISAYRARRQEP